MKFSLPTFLLLTYFIAACGSDKNNDNSESLPFTFQDFENYQLSNFRLSDNNRYWEVRVGGSIEPGAFDDGKPSKPYSRTI